MMISKKQMLRAALEAGRKVTGLSAMRDFNLYRLSSEIHQLRGEGMNIQTRMVDTGNSRHAEYYMERK